MSSPFVETAFALLRDRSIGDASQILLKQALDAGMPAGVKRYLLSEVVSFLENDVRQLPHFRRLHPDAPGSMHLRLAFLQSLAGGYELPRDQYLTLLREAIAFTESYLTRPQWTLESFLFEEEQEVDLDTLRARLAYLADYPYFGRLLEEILARRRSTRLARADFRSLVARIDDQIIQQHSPRELTALARPLFEFFLLKDAEPGDPIPLAPLLEFFEDKRLKVLKEYVQSICRLREISSLSMNNLRLLLEDLESVRKEDLPAQTLEPAAARERPAGEESSAPESAIPPLAQTPPAQQSATAGTPEPADSEPLPDLRGLIGEKQRLRFVRHVFNRDQAYFSGVISTLNTLRTWDEASAYLKKVYAINRLDPFSESVVEFTDLVQRRFSNETDAPR
jgi:hypothetical protein